jgi:CheY-like chemotaxis protein
VLCIDDNEDVLASVTAVLRNVGYITFAATSGPEGLRLLRTASVDLVVLDYEMPEMNGELIAQNIRKLKPKLPIVLFTGAPDDVPDRVRQNVNEVIYKADFSALLSGIEKLSRRTGTSPSAEAIRHDSDDQHH